MLHLLPQPAHEPTSEPYAEAVARLASVRHALRLVGPFGSGPASDLDSDEHIAAAWPQASGAQRRCFDRRSAQLVCGTAAGVEALLAARQDGREPHEQAAEALVDQIRRELEDVARVILD